MVCGQGLFPRPTLPAGRDFEPVRTSGVSLPPLRGRPRSRSHGRLRRPKSLPIRHSSAAVQCRPPLGWRDCSCFDLLAASIRKSGPEIKNRCSRGAISGQKPAAIHKLTPSNQESLQTQSHFRAIPCSDSQVYPLKSRITAAVGPVSEQSMQRFPNLLPEFKNRCSLIVATKKKKHACSCLIIKQ